MMKICFVVSLLATVVMCQDCSKDQTIMTNSERLECGLEEKTVIELALEQAVYPKWLFSTAKVRSGGFVIYVFGIMYAFLGISMVTATYVNPSIDIIKKRGIVSP